VLLNKDANYPWVILVPRREGVTEVVQLDNGDRRQLLDESCIIANCLTELFSPDKLNIATIGNIVSQLHMHHVCRFKTDACWPAPVWGQVPALGYDDEALSKLLWVMRNNLEDHIS
jgi:diadenosine tetraphosphate (Ap4A) HIT family hydrolase